MQRNAEESPGQTTTQTTTTATTTTTTTTRTTTTTTTTTTDENYVDPYAGIAADEAINAKIASTTSHPSTQMSIPQQRVSPTKDEITGRESNIESESSFIHKSQPVHNAQYDGAANLLPSSNSYYYSQVERNESTVAPLSSSAATTDTTLKEKSKWHQLREAEEVEEAASTAPDPGQGNQMDRGSNIGEDMAKIVPPPGSYSEKVSLAILTKVIILHINSQ
jgi:hypothetical protein